MTNGAPPKKKSRTFLYIGVGCLALVSMCCIGIGVAAFVRKSGAESGAQAHAETFLRLLQMQDWNGAYAASQYYGSRDLYTVDSFRGCVGSTPLGSVSNYSCSGAKGGWIESDHIDVFCTVTTMQGPIEVAIGVNPQSDADPLLGYDHYLGFIWFRPGAPVGPAWMTDQCATWSGRMFFGEPPAGFQRP